MASSGSTRRPAPSKYTMFWDSRQKKWVYESRPTALPSRYVDPRELQRQSRAQQLSAGGLLTPPLSGRSRSMSPSSVRTAPLPDSAVSSVSAKPQLSRKNSPVMLMTPPDTPPVLSAHLPTSNGTAGSQPVAASPAADEDEDEEVTIQVESSDDNQPSILGQGIRRTHSPAPLQASRPRSVSDVPDFVNEDASSLFIGLHSKRHAATAPAALFKSCSVENLNESMEQAPSDDGKKIKLHINTDVASILEAQRVVSTLEYERHRARQAASARSVRVPVTLAVEDKTKGDDKQGVAAQVRSKFHIPGFRKK